MKTFETPGKQTKLPIISLKGKDYLMVAHRLVWFREDHPDWGIETSITKGDESSAVARASITNSEGRVIATAHKFEDAKGFGDFIEKAETGAIGRALALCGYGTQFCADELDEQSRLADSPLPTKHETIFPNATVVPSNRNCPECGKKMLPSKFKPDEFWCPNKKNHKTQQDDLPMDWK